MNKLAVAFAALPMCAILALAQTTYNSTEPNQTNYANGNQQTLTGILVAAGCTDLNSPTAFNTSNQTNENSQYGQAYTNTAQTENPTNNQNNVESGTMNNMGYTGQTNNGYAANMNNKTGRQWARSCFISPSTTAFVLKLKDGRILSFDSGSDSQIVSQLQSSNRVQNMDKIFRARVKGNVDGDVIHLTSIKM
jgi:hypothetical protein